MLTTIEHLDLPGVVARELTVSPNPAKIQGVVYISQWITFHEHKVGFQSFRYPSSIRIAKAMGSHDGRRLQRLLGRESASVHEKPQLMMQRKTKSRAESRASRVRAAIARQRTP